MFNKETHDAAIEAVEGFYPPETPIGTVLATRNMMSLAIQRYCKLAMRVESPAKEIAEQYLSRNERFPCKETFVNKMTGKQEENSLMVPVKLLRELVEYVGLELPPLPKDNGK